MVSEISLLVASTLQVAKRALLAKLRAAAIAFRLAMTCSRQGGVGAKTGWWVGTLVSSFRGQQVDKSHLLQHSVQASIRLMRSIAVDPNSFG